MSAQKTRVLHVLDHSVPLHSGYSFRTLGILNEQRSRGWETLHATSMRQGEVEKEVDQIDGLEFYRTKLDATYKSLPLPFQLRLETKRFTALIDRICEQQKPDIIHAHSPVLTLMSALSVARKRKIPIVYEIRAFWEDAAVGNLESTEGNTKYRLTKFLEGYYARRADRLFVICQGLKDDLVKRGLEESRIEIARNAVDANRFSFDTVVDQELVASLGLQNKIVIGYIGSFYPYEGLDLLVDAFAKLTDPQDRYRLLLVGDGPSRESVEKSVARKGLEDRVCLTGRVPHDQVESYYSLVDILAFPRKDMRLTQLVTPLKPLEAMAMGKIVIASDVGGHKELIQNGETGFLFKADSVTDIAKCIESCVAEKSAWPKIRQRARSHVEEEFTWRNTVDQHAAVYQELCAGKM